MPILPEVQSDTIQAIKSSSGTLKYRLIGLYKHLLAHYDEEDRYSAIVNLNTYNSHTRVKELLNKAISIINNEIEIQETDLPELDSFFTADELVSEAFKTSPPQETNSENNLWYDTLMNVPDIYEHITEEDKEVLTYLEKIETFRYEDTADMLIEFTFKPNPFFANAKLRINTYVNEEDDIEIDKVRSDLIEWKPGQNYLVSLKKYRTKGRIKTKEERHPSFFWIFKNYNSDDFNAEPEEDDQSYEEDPMGDKALYEITCDIIYVLIDEMPLYVIPTYYGIDIPRDDELDSAEDEYVDCESDIE